MSKADYRELLNNIKDVVKLSTCATACGISRSSLSYFMKNENYDMMISISKLDYLLDYIRDKVSIL